MTRNESEERAYGLLMKFGIDAASISEPDKAVGSSRKEPDFLAESIAIEVKEIVPDREQSLQIQELKRQLTEEGRTIEYSTPIPRSQFLDDITDATQKFKNYPESHTILIVDLFQWFPVNIGIDRLMFGDETLRIDTKTFKQVGRTWQSRALQVGLRRFIGAYIFDRGFATAIYHNLHAYEKRKLPKEFCEQIQSKGFDQHFFYYDENNRPTVMYLAGNKSY